MPTIAVETELFNRIEQAAKERKANVNEMLDKAIRQYLWDLDRRKISMESQIYRQKHTELKKQYLGQYIAMYEGQVVDHDSNFATLHQRVRQQFGHTPVMITLVEETAENHLVRRGFRTETNNS
jgi:hypothetical protein